MQAADGALATALKQVRGCDVEVVAAANRAWWAAWWAEGAEVELGERRQVTARSKPPHGPRTCCSCFCWILN